MNDSFYLIAHVMTKLIKLSATNSNSNSSSSKGSKFKLYKKSLRKFFRWLIDF